MGNSNCQTLDSGLDALDKQLYKLKDEYQGQAAIHKDFLERHKTIARENRGENFKPSDNISLLVGGLSLFWKKVQWSMGESFGAIVQGECSLMSVSMH